MTLFNAVSIVEDESLVDNLYYSPKIGKLLIQCFIEQPLWSNVMCGKMGSKNLCLTSSASESKFKIIKRLLAIKTRRPDIFIDKHLDHLSGLLKLGLAQQQYFDRKDDWENKQENLSCTQQIVTDTCEQSVKRSLNLSDLDTSGREEPIQEPSENWRYKVKKELVCKQSRRSKSS